MLPDYLDSRRRIFLLPRPLSSGLDNIGRNPSNPTLARCFFPVNWALQCQHLNLQCLPCTLGLKRFPTIPCEIAACLNDCLGLMPSCREAGSLCRKSASLRIHIVSDLRVDFHNSREPIFGVRNDFLRWNSVKSFPMILENHSCRERTLQFSCLCTSTRLEYFGSSAAERPMSVLASRHVEKHREFVVGMRIWRSSSTCHEVYIIAFWTKPSFVSLLRSFFFTWATHRLLFFIDP